MLLKHPVLSPKSYVSKVKQIGIIDLKEGGSFLSDSENINFKIIPNILRILSSCVNFTKFEGSASEIRGCESIPANIATFACGSRIDSGHRLMKRCIRHAMDCHCASLVSAQVKIIKIDGELGFHVKHCIPASMRDIRYIIETSFTANALVMCQCSCKTGGEDNERGTCVHPLVCESLAEHYLLESNEQ